MVPSSSPKQIVRLTFDALNERDRSAFSDLHAVDAVMHGSNGPVRGIDAITAEEFGLFDAFSDLIYELQALLAEDDVVAARWIATGTHDGEGFADIAPTGETVAFDVMGLFRVHGDRIAEVWVLPDRLELMRQVGAVHARED